MYMKSQQESTRLHEDLAGVQTAVNSVSSTYSVRSLCYNEATMDDLDSLLAQFFDQLDARHYTRCSELLAAARLPAPAEPWLGYLRAILYSEQAPPRWDLAALELDQALTVTQDPRLRARLLLEWGIVADLQGEYELALGNYQESRRLFAALGDHVYQAKVLKNTGILHTHAYELGLAGTDALEDALACHKLALAALQGRSEDLLAASITMELGTVCKALKRWHEASAYYEECAALYRRLQASRKLALTLNNMGEVRHQLADYAVARDCFCQAITLFHALPEPDLYEEADAQANLARSCWANGETEAGCAASDRALALIEDIRDPLQGSAARSGFFGTRIHYYDARIQFELEQRRPDLALTYLERAKSRYFIEMLAGSSENDMPPHGGVAELTALRQVAPLTAEQIQARLPHDTILLEYCWQADRPSLLAVTCGAIVDYPLDRDRSAAIATVFDPDKNIPLRLTPDARGILHDPWPLHQLYQLLLAPVAAAVAQAQRVLIVPHGPLHYIPFHALARHQSGRADFWIEDANSQRELCYAPSATVALEYCQAKPPSTGKGMLALAYGDDLRFAQCEAELAVRSCGGRALCGDGATRSALRQHGTEHALVHFACHGRFDAEDPWNSGIRLSDGWLTAEEILQHLRLGADLVTLSGCETGRSKVRLGDEVVGLTRALLYAGAPSVLVSLWQTDDFATRHLMEAFYGHIAAGKSPARALLVAQMSLMRMTAQQVMDKLLLEGLPRPEATAYMARLAVADRRARTEDDAQHTVFSHPYYWAPFFLIGGRLHPSEATVAA